MKGRFELWTDAETDEALRLKAENKSGPEIARALGRTPGAIHARFRFILLTPEQKRARYLRYHKKARERERLDRTHSMIRNKQSARPSEAQFEERNRRLSRDRTIGQLLLGDPLPGQSALDKRMGA